MRKTPHGAIHWTTFSIFHGEERWRSEGVQIGGIKSARGNYLYPITAHSHSRAFPLPRIPTPAHSHSRAFPLPRIPTPAHSHSRASPSFHLVVTQETGILGNWFDKDYDVHGPAGPTAFWKVSDDVIEEKKVVNTFWGFLSQQAAMNVEDDEEEEEGENEQGAAALAQLLGE